MVSEEDKVFDVAARKNVLWTPDVVWEMSGGDRMQKNPTSFFRGGTSGRSTSCHSHNDAPQYVRHLKRLRNIGRFSLAEVGVLRGSGLAMWADFFPDADVYGFDIDFRQFWVKV